MDLKNFSLGDVQDLLKHYYSEYNKLVFQAQSVKALIADLEKHYNLKASESKLSGLTEISAPAALSSIATQLRSKNVESPIAPVQEKRKGRGRPRKEEVEETLVAEVVVKETQKTAEVAEKTPKPKGRPKSKDTKVSVEKPKKEKKPKPEKKESKGYKLSNWDNFLIEAIAATGKVLISTDLFDRVKERAMSAGVFEGDEQTKQKINRSLQKLANKRGDLIKVSYEGRGFGYGLPEWQDKDGTVKKKHALP